MKHDVQHYPKLNLSRFLGNPERVSDAVSDHYGLEHVEPQKEAVMHFLRLLQHSANAEDLGDLVLVAYHYLVGTNELFRRRLEARQARKEWQSSGIAQLSSKESQGGGVDARERFERARHRAESLEEKVANISQLVTGLLLRHQQVAEADHELALNLEKRRTATIESERWQAYVEEVYDQVHDDYAGLAWPAEHKRLDGLWGKRTSNDHRELVTEAVHAYLSDVHELIRAIDSTLMRREIDANERERAEERVRDLRRLSAHIVEQLERARALPDMLGIEAAALEELTLAGLPNIDDLSASKEVKAHAGSRLKSAEPVVRDVAVTTPSQRMAQASDDYAPPAPRHAGSQMRQRGEYVDNHRQTQHHHDDLNDQDDGESVLEMQLVELGQMLESQNVEMEALLEAKMSLEMELEELRDALENSGGGEDDAKSHGEAIAALEARLKAAQREKREERQIVEERDEEVHRLKTRETDLERTIKQLKDKLEGEDRPDNDAELAALRNAEAKANKEVDRLTSEVAKANKAILRLEGELESARDTYDGAHDDADFEELQRRYEELTSRVEEAETDIRSRELEIERLENEVHEQVQDHKETHRQLKAVAERSHKLEEALEEKRELIEELSESLDRRQLDHDRAAAELQRREERIHELREELRQTNSELQNVSDEYTQHRHELERRDRRIDHLEDMLGERLREVEELSNALEERSSQLREVMGQYEHTQGILKERSADLQRLADAFDDAQLDIERFRKQLETSSRETERALHHQRTLEDEVANRDREITRLYDLVESSTMAQQEAKREVKRVVEETRQERDQLRAELARRTEQEAHFERERDALRQRILNDEDQKRQLLDALAQKDEERRFEQKEMLEELREVRRETSSRNDVLKTLSSRMDEIQTRIESVPGMPGQAERRKKPRLSTEEIRRTSRYESSITEISDMLRRADSAQSGGEREELSTEISRRLDRLIRDAGGQPPNSGTKLVLPEQPKDRPWEKG